MRLTGRTLLFCPATRPDRFARAADAADLVVVDLEDSVAPEAKHSARETVASALRATDLDADRTVVRVNPLDGPWGEDDVAALLETPLRLVMLPKAADPQAVSSLAPWSVIALCETAQGVLSAHALARVEACIALAWGGEDLTADVGGRSSRGSDNRYLPLVEHARVQVLLAAGAAGKVAVDGVYLDIHDDDGLAAETAEAVSMGFAAKMAVHPRQVPTIRTAFRPAPGEVALAVEVLAGLDATTGVATVRGRMIDEPLLRQARAVLAAEEASHV